MMVRTWSVILGIGLIVLWIAGLSTYNSAPWMTWLDGVGGLWAFMIAGSVGPTSSSSVKARNPIALAIGLFALWIVGVSTGVVQWQSWWTFAFACAFVLVAIAGGVSGRQIQSTNVQDLRREDEQGRPRKSA